MAKSTEEYRTWFRENEISPHYSGNLHLAFVILFPALIIGGCLFLLENIQPLDWLAIPFTFLYANFIEYVGHKGPMHNKTRFLESIYQRHTLEHHQLFTETVTTCQSTRDYKMILFSSLMLFFFFGLFAIPAGFILYFIFSPNVCYFFVATSLAYYINYDLLHLSYHLDSDSWIGKIPFMPYLRKHHTLHHNRRLMNRYNFNISYPIFDHIFGTVYKGKET